MSIRLRLSNLLLVYLFAGMIFLSMMFLLYSKFIIDGLDRRNRAVMEHTLNFIANISMAIDSDTEKAISKIINSYVKSILYFPHILVDSEGQATVWVKSDKGGKMKIYTLSNDGRHWISEGKVVSAYNQNEIDKVIKEMDSRHPPIEVRVSQNNGSLESKEQIFMTAHYGDSEGIGLLRWMPVIQIFLVGGYIILGLLIYRKLRTDQQQLIWAGMAKETAHQLGTPLSSIIGWIELMKNEYRISNNEYRISNNEYRITNIEHQITDSKLQTHKEELLAELEKDCNRISKVVARFSKIGSQPKLEPTEIAPIISDVVNYIKTRLPQLGKKIQIIENYDSTIIANVNSDLIEWVIENLLKNAVDAMDKEEGIIQVDLYKHKENDKIEILVSDNGKGISSSERKAIFDPGYTTKRRGWGLGLTLTKRIVEEYHKGKIRLVKSEEGKGSTFSVVLPMGKKYGYRKQN